MTILIAFRQSHITHKVFAVLAARGKTSTGWAFGFKLHLVVNDQKETIP